MSGYGGMSTSGSKSGSMTQGGFESSTQLAPEQVAYLKEMWTQALQMLGDARAGSQFWNKYASENAQNVFTEAQPYWREQMQGGAFKDFDVGRMTDTIYGNMDQQGQNVQNFENMQNRQRGNLYSATNKSGNKLSRLTSKRIKRVSRNPF
jgi:hypothetical protein